MVSKPAISLKKSWGGAIVERPRVAISTFTPKQCRALQVRRASGKKKCMVRFFNVACVGAPSSDVGCFFLDTLRPSPKGRRRHE